MLTIHKTRRSYSQLLLVVALLVAYSGNTGWGGDEPAPRLLGLSQTPSVVSPAVSTALLQLSEAAVSFVEAKIVTNSIGMELVTVPAGEYMMGSPDDDERARDDEKPQHLVRITKPLLVGRYEVTQGAYHQVQGTNPSWFSKTGGGQKKVDGLDTNRFPVERISWDDAVEFCKKLSELPAEKAAGRSYRLLTEAEWQYCCRAGTTTAFHYGASLSSNQANINGRFPYGGAKRGPYLGRTTAVGSYEPNAFGLYDMHGNVGELCFDWFGRDYYQQSPTDDPPGPEKGADHLLMGGSWSADAFRCRAAHRRSNASSGIARYFGFRVVCDQ